MIRCLCALVLVMIIGPFVVIFYLMALLGACMVWFLFWAIKEVVELVNEARDNHDGEWS